jgi:hypothetical protein
MKNGQKLKLGDAHVTPKKYPRGTSVKAWGCPRGTPFFIGKNQVTFQHTIFLLLHALYVFLGASVVFAFSFPFVLFSAINGLITSCCFGGRCTLFFIAKNTLVFTLFVQRVFSFSPTAFSFYFSP